MPADSVTSAGPGQTLSDSTGTHSASPLSSYLIGVGETEQHDNLAAKTDWFKPAPFSQKPSGMEAAARTTDTGPDANRPGKAPSFSLAGNSPPDPGKQPGAAFSSDQSASLPTCRNPFSVPSLLPRQQPAKKQPKTYFLTKRRKLHPAIQADKPTKRDRLPIPAIPAKRIRLPVPYNLSPDPRSGFGTRWSVTSMPLPKTPGPATLLWKILLHQPALANPQAILPNRTSSPVLSTSKTPTTSMHSAIRKENTGIWANGSSATSTGRQPL